MFCKIQNSRVKNEGGLLGWYLRIKYGYGPWDGGDRIPIPVRYRGS
jgi:hypothetical protein